MKYPAQLFHLFDNPRLPAHPVHLWADRRGMYHREEFGSGADSHRGRHNPGGAGGWVVDDPGVAALRQPRALGRNRVALDGSTVVSEDRVNSLLSTAYDRVGITRVLVGTDACAPGLIAKASYSLDRQWLEEEQAAIGQPKMLRIQQVRWENELRQGLANIGESLRAATDAAKAYVTTAAGGPDAVGKSPLACRHLSLLTRYSRPLPATETIRLRLGLLAAAWEAMDAAMASLGEIMYEAESKPVASLT